MFVYLDAPRPAPRHTMFVCPGKDSDAAEFKDSEGKPEQFAVVFENGRAEVPDALGRWMVDHGVAKSTSLFVPRRRKVILLPDGGVH